MVAIRRLIRIWWRSRQASTLTRRETNSGAGRIYGAEGFIFTPRKLLPTHIQHYIVWSLLLGSVKCYSGPLCCSVNPKGCNYLVRNYSVMFAPAGWFYGLSPRWTTYIKSLWFLFRKQESWTLHFSYAVMRRKKKNLNFQGTCPKLWTIFLAFAFITTKHLRNSLQDQDGLCVFVFGPKTNLNYWWGDETERHRGIKKQSSDGV